MLKIIIVAYIEKKTTITERKHAYLPYSLSENGKLLIQNTSHVLKIFIVGLRSAWFVVFFCRIWFTWTKFKTFNSNAANRKQQKLMLCY